MYKGKRGPRRFATSQREDEPKVGGMMSMEVLEQRREEMLREAELNQLKKVLRGDRKGPIASRWASTVAWEVTRAVGLLRKSFRTKNAG
jgi:hypothetical protein